MVLEGMALRRVVPRFAMMLTKLFFSQASSLIESVTGFNKQL